MPRTFDPAGICRRASAITMSPAASPLTICTRVPSDRPSVTTTVEIVSPSTFWTMRLPSLVMTASLGTSTALATVDSVMRAVAYMPDSNPRLLFGTRLTARFVAGGTLGLAGVALIFWPEFGRAAGQSGAALGALFTLGAVLLSTVGSLAASRNRENRLPFWPALGFGMLYGAAISAASALAQGQSFALPSVASWWASLLYLALAGSVLAFACFLTLQQRLGVGPAGSVGVMTPLLALVISTAFERFRPDALTFAGAGLAVLGNVLMLTRRPTPVVAVPAALPGARGSPRRDR